MKASYYVPWPGRQTWPAQSWQVLPMLGVPPRGHLPTGGIPPRNLNGIKKVGDVVQPVEIKVWVDPFVSNGRRKQSVHRVKCTCPGCDRIVSLGRLAQHVCSS